MGVPFLAAIGSMLLAIVCSVVVFAMARRLLGVPWLLNVPGALLTFLMVIGLTGSIVSALGVFDNQIGPPPPDIPWYIAFIYGAFTVFWYTLMGLLVRLWRKVSKSRMELSRQ